MPKKSNTKKVEDLKQEIANLTTALQQERADAENIRRRHQTQLSSLQELAKISVVKELLPAIDNFERALAHTPKDLKDHQYVKGVAGVVKQFEKSLHDLGVKRIIAVGELFDPKLHEAVGSEGDGEAEVVSEELQAGYLLGAQVIRHAMVKVKRI